MFFCIFLSVELYHNNIALFQNHVVLLLYHGPIVTQAHIGRTTIIFVQYGGTFRCKEEHFGFCLANRTGADTGGVDRVDIHPPFFSKKKIRNVTLFEIENKERKKN